MVWLLEELELPYTLKKYARNENFRAPVELETIHPLGKLPVVEIIKQDGTIAILAESGHIFQYLISKHNPKQRLLTNLDADKERVDYFMHYCEGTLQSLIVLLLINSMVKQKSPWGIGFLASLITGALNKFYYATELFKNLEYLESLMQQQHAANSEYFVGETLTGADIILSFPIWQILFKDPVSAEKRIGQSVDLRKKYPHLNQWSQMILSVNRLAKLADQDTEEY